jgi:hypothetical protein
VPEDEFESQVAAGTSTESIIAHHDIQERGGLPKSYIDPKAQWGGCKTSSAMLRLIGM